MNRARQARIIRRTVGASAVLWILLWLLTAFRSPINPLLMRFASRRKGDSTWQMQRAGLYGGLNRLKIRGFKLSAPWIGAVTAEDIEIRFRLFPLASRRLSLRTIDITRMTYNAEIDPDTDVTIPPLPAAWLDLTAPPTLHIQPLDITLAILDPSADAPFRVHLSNGSTGAALKPASAQHPPYAFRYEAQAIVNNGDPATIRVTGRLDPLAIDAETLNLDANFLLSDLALSDMTATRSNRFPFIAQRGCLRLNFDLCARHGRLSGLASLRIREMEIRPNPNAENARFLTLTFNAWNFLARQRNGIVEADADIRGSAMQPVVPLGQVLQHQARQIGRGLTTRMIDTIPSDAARGQAERLAERREEAEQHDDILKIARLPEHERHFERGRHYERIVRGYSTALSEYQLQVERYPTHTNLAVQALMHAALLRNKHLDQPTEALADLRRILEDYPQHDDADDALFEMIRIAQSVRDYPHATRLCDEFLERFPDSPLRQAVNRTKERIRRYVW